ncbi:hypothetical protein E3J84_00080 [Candidatus Aerophobetes bacterium]|uniref:Uncharacterized protein n=1 Tax=Aerophobetes bacterium TaxID=2030807 RepID=A0A523S5R8_UNCAE|nr:MAG: hypothetical protein E3J84_00080 [Candidatus Aerophobetes bacterium]
MKATFTCRANNLSFNTPIARFEDGRLISLNPRIRFRNHLLETEDAWEIKQVREWMQKHPRDEITELK